MAAMNPLPTAGTDLGDEFSLTHPNLPSRPSSEYILHSKTQTSDEILISGVTTLPELFRWQAQRRQDATLFSFHSSTSNRLITISYIEAYKQATKLASNLQSHFHKSSQETPVVGVWLERSIDLHLAVLGTTISGATWLPFDADAPATRVATCLDDSRSCVLLCDDAHYEDAVTAVSGVSGCRVVTFKQLSSTTSNTPQKLSGPRPHDTAYMIYTSGSTGTPKGIEIPHSAAVTFSLSERSVLETGPNDVVWQGFSAAFDMWIEETWVSIAGGAHLAIGTRLECQDVPSLGGANGIWAQRNVTLANAVPTLINIMTSLDSECPLPPSVRLLNLGGEACPAALVNRIWSPRLRIINTYGPSETTVTATFEELFPDQIVTIGKPLPLYHAMVLTIRGDTDTTFTPVPIKLEEGAEGELAIGGPCLGKGYVQRPELTQEKFMPHPLPTQAGERLYRTGDLVRLDKDLNIVFLGRIDTQVKHRGFRIELGEIEHALATHPQVQTAAVILSACTDRLEAFIAVQDLSAIEIRELRDVCRHLPAYMQPEEFFLILPQDMPRLPSGKINAKALQQTSEQFAAAETDKDSDCDALTINSSSTLYDNSTLGTVLRAMVETFPKSAKITASSDFFDDLGGHSLIAAQLVSRLRKEAVEGSGLAGIGLSAIYKYRTAENIATSLGGSTDSEKNAPNNAEMGEHLPVSKYKYFFCGLAQIPALFVLFTVEAICILVPYLVFDYFLRIYNVGIAIVVTYGVFVAIPIFRTVFGILGKWIVLGKAKAGEYPLYGVYYYRWWFADHLTKLVDLTAIADTPMMPVMLRLMGAKVGQFCHIGPTSCGPAYDLITIGDDVVVYSHATLNTNWVERGRLILAPVTIGSDSFIGDNSVLEGNTTVEEGGELGPMSMLPVGSRIPAGERWVGSPAQYRDSPNDIGNMRATRPSRIRTMVMGIVMALSATFIIPIIYYAPQLPSILLFELLNVGGVGWYTQTAFVAIPAGIIYMIMVFLELIILRWLFLGKVVEREFRTTSVYAWRKWFVDQLMGISLVVLQSFYATLYVVPFLRSLGVKIGRGAEISTARGINFQLTEIGEESFVADRVLVGGITLRNNMITMKKTTLQKRAFLGNGAQIPQGSDMASDTLVGVMSYAPKTPLKEGQSCFGVPAVILPARQTRNVCHTDTVLYNPSKKLIAMRLFVEGIRIIAPRCLITFGLGFSLQAWESGWSYIGFYPMILLLPVFYLFFFAVPAIVFLILIKWTLVGKYRATEWPLWSLNVWKSELVTSVYELLSPISMNMLTGTPFMALFLRALGTKIGSCTTLLSNDITEFDLVTLGDEATMNEWCGTQTHLFQDRVMNLGPVTVEKRGCMKPCSVALPGSTISEGGMLGSLSCVMKGETVPRGEMWEGSPIGPRKGGKSA